MFSASAGLLCLFEISLANDQNLSEHMSVLSELMPYGMGFFAVLMPIQVGMDSFQSFADDSSVIMPSSRSSNLTRCRRRPGDSESRVTGRVRR